MVAIQCILRLTCSRYHYASSHTFQNERDGDEMYFATGSGAGMRVTESNRAIDAMSNIDVM